jgi:hypothetical protein
MSVSHKRKARACIEPTLESAPPRPQGRSNRDVLDACGGPHTRSHPTHRREAKRTSGCLLHSLHMARQSIQCAPRTARTPHDPHGSSTLQRPSTPRVAGEQLVSRSGRAPRPIAWPHSGPSSASSRGELQSCHRPMTPPRPDTGAHRPTALPSLRSEYQEHDSATLGSHPIPCFPPLMVTPAAAS